ncbi:CNNM domain-containing protein [Stenotrophomonas maltophilia]|uniref:CNNM domain-containing protein n=1 Tax=Stenotrophomonas maltophilia TaxID=40324 RepID=UPI003D0405BA
MLNSILVILCLIAVSAFFSISEISLAASRKIKLKLLADEGNVNAQRVLKMQENPGTFFTVLQNCPHPAPPTPPLNGPGAVAPFPAGEEHLRRFLPPPPPLSVFASLLCPPLPLYFP